MASTSVLIAPFVLLGLAAVVAACLGRPGWAYLLLFVAGSSAIIVARSIQ